MSSATTAADGPRTAWRLIIPTVMDIVPTYAMFMDTNRNLAAAFWHWYFLAQPEPFPERLIGNDPDFFYETCLVGWAQRASTISIPRCLPGTARRGESCDDTRNVLGLSRRRWDRPAARQY
jgi:hypothetical protein